MPAVVLYVLLYFSRYRTVWLKCLFFVCLFFVYYLCEKYYRPITVQYYIADCVGWVPRVTFEQIGLMNKLDVTNMLLEWNSFVCRELTVLWVVAASTAKLLQSCPTLPIDGSPPGSAIPGTLQARTLEWVAISFSNAWKWKVKVKSLSRVWLFTTPCTAAYQAPPSMRCPRREYWSGVPLPSPVDGGRVKKIKTGCYVCLRAQSCPTLCNPLD